MLTPSAPVVRCLGLIINPIAGMGGRVGLKGTDGVAARAVQLGARPVAPLRALQTLQHLQYHLRRRDKPPPIRWLSGAGPLGGDCLHQAGFDQIDIVHSAAGESCAADTQAAVKRFTEHGCDLVMFCGGDGTARDVSRVTGFDTPLLGIPSGVKMYSGVFGINPQRTAETLLAFLDGRLELTRAELLDLDEQQYRCGRWTVRLYGAALTPSEPALVQSAKMLFSNSGEDDAQQAIAEHLCEAIEASDDKLWLLGPGTTVKAIADRLGVAKTLLGIDALEVGKPVARDLNEEQLLRITCGRRCRLVISPIGAQGFILGRGNLQLSPAVIENVGARHIMIIATPAKLAATPVLRVDSGDRKLDHTLAANGYLPVITGYRRRRLVKVQI